MHVVVVESPAKAKTVQQYLGGDYRVLASWGHVRDLPAKDGSVRPGSGFEMTYASGPRARRVLGRIRTALKGADSLILATDPDREGEAIAWQVLTWLQERDAIGERPVRRVAFHEITPEAVRAAMASPREIDMDLVHAQQARRALDYLVGFHLSPVLWRKLPGSRSAGRVQSVALRLICEREAEIENFAPREYWTVEARVMAHAGGTFTARLSGLDGVELGSLALESGTMAQGETAGHLGGALERAQVLARGDRDDGVARGPRGQPPVLRRAGMGAPGALRTPRRAGRPGPAIGATVARAPPGVDLAAVFLPRRAPGLQCGAGAASRSPVECRRTAGAAEALGPPLRPDVALADAPPVAATLASDAALNRFVPAAPGAEPGGAAGVVAALRVGPPRPPLRLGGLSAVKPALGPGARVAVAVRPATLLAAIGAQPAAGLGRAVAATGAESEGNAPGGDPPVAPPPPGAVLVGVPERHPASSLSGLGTNERRGARVGRPAEQRSPAPAVHEEHGRETSPHLHAGVLQGDAGADDDLVAPGPQALDRAQAHHLARLLPSALSALGGAVGADVSVGRRVEPLDEVSLVVQPPPEHVGQVRPGASLECAVDLHMPPPAGW